MGNGTVAYYTGARNGVRFDKCLDLVLAHEGYFTNNPKDPGGPTNRGVTQTVYDSYRNTRDLEPRSVEYMSHDELRSIYANQFWKRIGADYLPEGIDYAAFDYAVNSGVARAVKDLQRCVGAAVDGVMGVETIDQVQSAYKASPDKLILNYCGLRMAFLKSLSTYGTFGKGWKRRVMGDFDGVQDGDMGVIDLATMMAKTNVDPAIYYPSAVGSKPGEINGKAPERSQSIMKTKAGVATATVTAGISGQAIFTAADQVAPHINEGLFGKIALIVFLSLIVIGAGLFIYEYAEKLEGRAT